MRKLNLTKILVTGDSNGYKCRDQLQYFLCNRSNSCQLDIRGIQRYRNCSKPQSEWGVYFRMRNKTHDCLGFGCEQCEGQTYLVKGFGPDRLNITLEFIGMISFINSSIRFSEEPDMSDYILDESTSVEVFLPDYLSYYGFPDIWFISPPLHHEA